MDNKYALSVTIIAYNEEKNIQACLDSVSFADDIVVVDSESSDSTALIAERFGARVFVEKWKGFGPQKNSAVSKCLHDWVLIIDADERVTEELKREIIKIVQGLSNVSAYSFPRKNYFHGRWIKRCGWWPDRVVRLVKKTEGRFEAMTHERWATAGEINDSIEAAIEHHSFKDYTDMLERLNRYSSAIANEHSGTPPSVIKSVISGVVMFIKIYFIQLGLLEGLDGLVIALTKAGGSFFKYAKMIEAKRNIG